MLTIQKRRKLVKQFLEIRDEYKKPTFSLRKKQILQTKKTELIHIYYERTKHSIYHDCDESSKDIQLKEEAVKLQKIIKEWIEYVIPMIRRIDKFLIFLEKNPVESSIYEFTKKKFSVLSIDTKKPMNIIYQIRSQGDKLIKNEKFTDAAAKYYYCKLKLDELCNNLIFNLIKANVKRN